VFLGNVAALVGNYLRAGVTHLVLAGAVRDRAELERMAATVWG